MKIIIVIAIILGALYLWIALPVYYNNAQRMQDELSAIYGWQADLDQRLTAIEIELCNMTNASILRHGDGSFVLDKDDGILCPPTLNPSR